MTKVKDLKKEVQPREKLAKYGTGKLTDAELLAILLRTGTTGMNVLSMSNTVLKKIAQIGSHNVTEENLKSVRGLGGVKRQQILALLELSNRFSSRKTEEILSSKDIWHLCNDFCASRKEHFVAFYLNTQSQLIERRIISIGILDASLVHPREVFEPALSLHAASIIVAHNHPSSDLRPSEEDILLTKNLIEAGKILGIPIEDHVIITQKDYLSLRYKGEEASHLF